MNYEKLLHQTAMLATELGLHWKAPVFVLRGIPGAGKSRLAGFIKDFCGFSTRIFSADDAFKTPSGERVFKPELLTLAHKGCFRNFGDAVVNGSERVALVVDNTNTQAFEFAPYMVLAAAYERLAVLVTVEADVEECLLRQTHNVPVNTVQHMKGRLNREKIPAWFHQFTVINSTKKDTVLHEAQESQSADCLSA